MKNLIYVTILAVITILTLSNIATPIYHNSILAFENTEAKKFSGSFNIAANDIKIHQAYFNPGEYITLTMECDKNLSRLEIYIYDPTGRQVRIDDYTWNGRRISFYAEQEGNYSVEVINQNNLENRYELDIK